MLFCHGARVGFVIGTATVCTGVLALFNNGESVGSKNFKI